MDDEKIRTQATKILVFKLISVSPELKLRDNIHSCAQTLRFQNASLQKTATKSVSAVRNSVNRAVGQFSSIDCLGGERLQRTTKAFAKCYYL
jgi:hypothetical protein